jgi:hypothetical protein
MLIRICLFIAIAAALGVGALNFTKVKEKITTLQTDLKTQTDARASAESQLRDTKKELDKTAADLKTTKANLETTTAEKEKAVAEANAQTTRANKLTEDLNKTRTERDTAQAELAAYHVTGYSPEQIVSMGKQFKGLQDSLAGTQEENKLLGQKIVKLDNRLLQYEHPELDVPLPATIKGKVLVCDPKWNFVVLNAGAEQGMLERGELLVNRDGKLVAKVRVTVVEKDRSIANVLPGWQLGEVMEGDLVIPAHPES